MQAHTAYYENGRIIPIGNPIIPERRKLVITVLDEDIEPHVQESKITRATFLGCMKGKIRMSDDFDEPLEEMRDYM